MKIKQIIRDYFTFTHGERIGLFVLVGIMLLIMLANQFIFYFEKPGVANREQFDRLLVEFEKNEETTPVLLHLFAFDPNLIDSVALDSLNLPLRIRKNLLRYRERGGHFRTKADIRKLYGMNDSIFAKIGPYIVLPENIHLADQKSRPETKPDEAKAFVHNEKASQQEVLNIEINRATAEELEKLDGIGPVLSKRIVKYRNLLGGFFTVDQLNEVYGLKPELVDKLKLQLTVNLNSIAQLNINFSETKDLAAHPYLKWENAKKIEAYRTRNGFIPDVDLLLSDSVINQLTFKKVRHYLKVKN